MGFMSGMREGHGKLRSDFKRRVQTEDMAFLHCAGLRPVGQWDSGIGEPCLIGVPCFRAKTGVASTHPINARRSIRSFRGLSPLTAHCRLFLQPSHETQSSVFVVNPLPAACSFPSSRSLLLCSAIVEGPFVPKPRQHVRQKERRTQRGELAVDTWPAFDIKPAAGLTRWPNNSASNLTRSRLGCRAFATASTWNMSTPWPSP
jgi:hypothetical protein